MKAKFTLLVALFIMLNISASSQGVGINEDGSSPDNSAMLDVKSSIKGVLLPRMTNTQMLAIPTVATGLMIFNTTQDCIFFYNSSDWVSLCSEACPLPALPGLITGNSTISENATGETYSISAVTLATSYTWAVPSGATITTDNGTDIITDFLTTSGGVTVFGTNACGDGPSQTLSVSVCALPSQPGTITGDATPTTNSTGVTYSILAVAGAASYTWSVPSDATITADNGTNIVVTFGTASGNISVYATNACANSTAQTLAITAVPPFFCGTSTIDDIDGNTYNTVLIGTQCWLKEDLKVGTYPNGDPIPYKDKDAKWANLTNDNVKDAYTVYGDTNNDGIVKSSGDYGYLYSYAAAIADNWVRDNNINQGICPDGWHLPTDTEWMTLEEAVETTVGVDWNLTGLRGTDVGSNLKEAGTTHWSTGGNNSSGFTALPSGRRKANTGLSKNKGTIGYWWTASENSGEQSMARKLTGTDTSINRMSSVKGIGFSVRCVKD